MPVLFAVILAAAPNAKPDLAMMDMKAVHGVEDSLAAVLNESFLVALKNSNQFGSVVGGSDLRAMLDLEQQKQALGCGDDGVLVAMERGGDSSAAKRARGGRGVKHHWGRREMRQ